MNNILNSIKKLLGISEEHKQFDSDIKMYIGSAFIVLSQIGVKELTNITITDEILWSDILPENLIDIVRTFIYLKVRLLFDSPLSSIVMESLKSLISEYEWRIYVEVNKS